MSVRRASLLLSLHTIVAAATTTTSASPPSCIRPRRPRTSFSSSSSSPSSPASPSSPSSSPASSSSSSLPSTSSATSFTFAPPPHSTASSPTPVPSSPLPRCVPALSPLSRRRPCYHSPHSNLPHSSLISHSSTLSSFIPSAVPLLTSTSSPSSTSVTCTSPIASVGPFRVVAASLCMVCQSTASSDDAVPTVPTVPAVSNHLLISHSHGLPSSASISSPMSDPNTCSVTLAHSDPSSSLHASSSLHTTTSSTSQLSSSSSSLQPSDPNSSALSHPSTTSIDSASSASNTRTSKGDVPREPSNDHESESDTALSTSTVTSDLADVPASDSLERRDPRVRLAFRTGVAFIPHPDKREKGGEDAFFTQDHALGVFDGVGGWSSVGVDAGLYSKELARLTSMQIKRDGPASAVEALKSATERNHAIGSSTACVVGLDSDRLVGVNLGDSGLLVIRRGDIVYRTDEQQHYFNCPYQVGTDSTDTIDIGAPIEFFLQHGDCIIMGTDGLWDNVFANEVLQIVIKNGVATNSTSSQSNQPSSNSDQTKSNDTGTDASSMVSDCLIEDTDVTSKDAQGIAVQLAEAAVRVANDERGISPFSVNAHNAGHMFLGGKVDDITILAALVVDISSYSDTMDKESPTSIMDSSSFDSKHNRSAA